MLQSPIKPSNHTLRGERKRKAKTTFDPSEDLDFSFGSINSGTNANLMADAFDDDGSAGEHGGTGGKGRSKSRRELPAGAVATLKAWLLSPEHFTHPYPTPQDQAMLMQKTGIDKKQLKNWFTNARRRIWKPMLKKQIEQGKLSGGPAGVPGAMPGMMLPGMQGGATNPSMDNPHSVQAMRAHYQQAMQEQPQQQQQQQQNEASTSMDSFGNIMYASNQPQDASNQYYEQTLAPSASLGTLPQTSSTAQMSKTDSHAVLMELFARDQDLVRQATESAKLKKESKQQQQTAVAAPMAQQPAAPTSQHPMMKGPPGTGALQTVPTLNSWPHFSSITSLNNLGTIPGVKSIASLSGQDLASKGNVNKMGNLAQVKSMESMGKNDSYAFLEVFFGDRSSTNLSGMAGGSSGSHKGVGKGEEDNEIGLSLDDDQSPSHPIKKEFASAPVPPPPGMPNSAPPARASVQQDSMDSGTIKRAYDDAMAARGLMSVSRSCEKLTDLVLPAKIQRTLSQEFISKQQEQQARQQRQDEQEQNEYSSYSSLNQESSGHQYPGQHPTEPQGNSGSDGNIGSLDGHVQVSATATCVLCSQNSVDTQLRPCGHMFHERCLKPSLTNPVGQPKCPMDGIPIHSAVLAIPEQPSQQQNQSSWSYSNTQQARI